MSALDEKTRAERALKDLQKGQGDDTVMWKLADIFSIPELQCNDGGADSALGLLAPPVAR